MPISDSVVAVASSVVLVHVHPALREGLGILLGGLGVEVVGSTGDYETALELVDEEQPDVVLLDLDHFEQVAGQFIGELHEQDSGVGVLVYCASPDGLALGECLELGARGCVSKDAGSGDLLRAIDTVANGDAYSDPRLKGFGDEAATGEPSRVLTPREAEVLGLLASGLTGAQAAKRLWLSPETVRTHVRNAMTRLNANTRAHAVALALAAGEISLEDQSLPEPDLSAK